MTEHTQSIILFLVDGMRPDALAQADTPVIDRLIATGASTLSAQTVMPSISLPCIASLFLGTPPARHGITTNAWAPTNPNNGLIEVLATHGRSAASFYNWEPLRDLSPPGALQAAFFVKNDQVPEGRGDTALAALAARYLSAEPVDFAFLYLGHTDSAGHAHGWMSAPYLAAIENADRAIGAVLDHLGDGWGVVVTADHGGHDRHHGTEQAVDMTIPMVIHGHPRLGTGAQLPTPATILDIAPTIAAWMGLTPAPAWLGKDLASGRAGDA